MIKENKYLKVKTAQNNIGVMSLPIPVNIAQSKNKTKPNVYTMGKKHYETTDRPGNVRVTYTDKKSWNNGKFSLNVSSSQDYYPFGSVMEGRVYSFAAYRFGFNGKENDNEVIGMGRWQDYGARMYRPDLARFFSPDPLIVKEQKFPWYSPYQFAGNKPIFALDLDGKEVLKISFEAIMRAERELHNRKEGDMSNGYRYRKTFGKGKLPELRVPRSRRGNFFPILLALLRNREEEARKLAFNLYGAGLTTAQVGEIFGDIYGKQYSPSQISRLFEYARSEVQAWLTRPLESYYPIILIDATFIHTRRVDHVSKEAYYTILGVRKDRSREVLAIVNFPTESAKAWEDVFDELKKRGLQQVPEKERECLLVNIDHFIKAAKISLM